MTSAKRPSNSCWTCRIRRKKCNEGLPFCATCERLGIECFIAGKKPEFMDGGDKEKHMSVEIRALVKAKNDSLRRSRALEARHRRQCQSQKTVSSSENDVPASKTMRPQAERVKESLIPGSNPPSASSLQSLPSSLRNQDSQDLTSKRVSCEQWVEILIDEIDTLGMQRDNLSNQLDKANDFQFKAERLQKLLEEGVRHSHLKNSKLTATAPDRSIQPTEAEMHSRRTEVSLVTCAFVHAALIYLHITLHGTGTNSRTLPGAKKLVFEWIFVFRFLPDYTLLPSLVWPLCIAGCMATTVKQKQFFRETVISSGIHRLSTCMIWRALEIMETCWKVPANDGMQHRDLMRELGILRNG